MQRVVVGRCPRKEVWRSAKPFGSIREGQKGRHNPRGIRRRRLLGKSLQVTTEGEFQVDRARESEGRWRMNIHLSSSFFLRGVVTIQDPGEQLERVSYREMGWG